VSKSKRRNRYRHSSIGKADAWRVFNKAIRKSHEDVWAKCKHKEEEK